MFYFNSIIKFNICGLNVSSYCENNSPYKGLMFESQRLTAIFICGPHLSTWSEFVEDFLGNCGKFRTSTRFMKAKTDAYILLHHSLRTNPFYSRFMKGSHRLLFLTALMITSHFRAN